MFSKEIHVNGVFRNAITALLLALLASVCLSQQVTKVGTTAAKFLSIPVGARAVGMGGAFVAVANDASAMYWNPSGLAKLTQSEAIFTHANWIADISFNYGGVVIPLRELGTVGVNFTSMTMDEMERTTEELPEGTGQTFSAGSFAVGVAYGKKLTDWFSIGANVKYINEHIWNSTATGLAVDVGTLFTTPFAGLKFGAGITNFGQKMRIGGDDLLVQKDISPIQGNNPNINANLSTDGFDLPLTLRIGFAYDVIENDDQQFTLVADASHPNDNAESVNVGGELSMFQRMFSIRGGYKGLWARDGEEQFTFGGGLQYGIGDHISAKLDYGYLKFGRLSNIHKFTVAFIF